MTDHPDYGACCACGQAGPTVRNIIALDRRGPVPGQGWGCLACNLPADGACTVVCDACLDADRPYTQVVKGFISHGERVPLASLTEPFAHDPACHPGEVV
jgi:hypothetical protein